MRKEIKEIILHRRLMLFHVIYTPNWFDRLLRRKIPDDVLYVTNMDNQGLLAFKKRTRNGDVPMEVSEKEIYWLCTEYLRHDDAGKITYGLKSVA